MIVSGFYHEKTDSFVVPKTTIRKTGLVTPSFSKIKGKRVQMVTFQLRDGRDRIRQEIKRPVLKTDIEVLYTNRAPKRIPFDFYHFLTVFHLPESYRNGGLKVIVISPKGRMIYSSPVKINKKKESVVLLTR